MITLVRPKLVVREATLHDVVAIREMRRSYEREFVGTVDVPLGVTWFVAACGDRIVACLGTGIATQRRLIVTDLYAERSYAGKRGLVLLFDEMRRARAKIYVQVPFDRPELKRALERRGIAFNAWCGEYPAK